MTTSLAGAVAIVLPRGAPLWVYGALMLATVPYAQWSAAGWGLTLVAMERADSITHAILPSAGVALATVGPLAVAFGARGAIGGEIAAELVGLAVQARAVRSRRPVDR